MNKLVSTFLVILLAIFIVSLGVMVGKKVTKVLEEGGYCYVSTQAGAACGLASSEVCEKQGGKHFGTMEDCKKYWKEQNEKPQI